MEEGDRSQETEVSMKAGRVQENKTGEKAVSVQLSALRFRKRRQETLRMKN
jgi:hypothetical protein